MDCRECSELLSEYIDGRLAVEDAAALAAHLEKCPDCRALEQELRTTVSLVAGLEQLEAPEGLADGVRARIERRLLLDGPPARAKRRFLPWSLGGVGLAAAALILVTLYVHRAPETEPPTAEHFLAREVRARGEEKDADTTTSDEGGGLSLAIEEDGNGIYVGGRLEAGPVPTVAEPSTEDDRAGAYAYDRRLRANDRGFLETPSTDESFGFDVKDGFARTAEGEARTGEAVTWKYDASARQATADAETLDRLKSLGYVEGGPARAAGIAEAKAAADKGAEVAASAPSTPAAAAGPVAGQALRGAGEGGVTVDDALAEIESAQPKSGEKAEAEIPVIEFVSEQDAVQVATLFANYIVPPEKQMKAEKPSTEEIRRFLTANNFQVIELSAAKAVLQTDLRPTLIISNNAEMVQMPGVSQSNETPRIITSQVAPQVRAADSRYLAEERGRRDMAAVTIDGVEKPLTVKYVFIQRLPEPPPAPPRTEPAEPKPVEGAQ